LKDVGDTELGPVGTFIGHCGFLPQQIEGSGPEIAYAKRKSMWIEAFGYHVERETA